MGYSYARRLTYLSPLVAALTFSVFAVSLPAHGQSLNSGLYDIGSPAVIEYFVDPANGSDRNNGRSRSAPKKTVSSLWNELPENRTISQGVKINLLPGTYGTNHLPNYWENRTGSSDKPIILSAVDGFGTVSFSRDINMAGVSYFYLLGVSIINKTTEGYGDAFHCERCDHILLRGNSFNGAPNGRNAGGDIAHETIKFNQSQYVYIENNNIQGADDNGIDWVAVQYGHIRGNRIHDTEGWCMYTKGGSSYVLIESNTAYQCGEGGITAGQGTGFEFMTSPWLRYEANYIKIVNNIIHDIQGAAIGVNGGYGILVAHNTAYKIGTRSHLLEVVFGERSCDGDATRCSELRSAGGWGPTAIGSSASQPIGNQDLVIANNIFYNPTGTTSGSQHFAIYGPRTPTASDIPSPQKTDTKLHILGNIIWNGSASYPLGIEDSDQGCQSGNPDCTESQLRANNTINSFEPDFLLTTTDDFRPASGGRIAALVATHMPDHETIDSDLNPITEGDRSNQLSREFSGNTTTLRPPGAVASSESALTPPSSDSDSGTPNPSNQPPSLTITKAVRKITRNKATVTINALASDDSAINSVEASILSGSQVLGALLLQFKNGSYTGKKTILNKKKLSVQVVARDDSGMASVKNKLVK